MVTSTTWSSLQESIKWYSDNDGYQSTTTENHKMGTIETKQAKILSAEGSGSKVWQRMAIHGD